MNHELLAVKRSTYLRASLLSHLITILVGLGTYAIFYWFVQLGTTASLSIAILLTIIINIISTRFMAQRSTGTMKQLSEQIGDLKAHVTHAETAKQSQAASTQALVEEIPVGLLVFNQRVELTTANQQALMLLGVEPDPKTAPQATLETLKTLRSNNSPVHFIDWLHEVKNTKIQDRKVWPMVVVEHNGITTVFDIIAIYTKNDSHDREVVMTLVDRSADYDRREKQMEFIALAAHELRGPITVMRGLIDVFQTEIGSSLDADHSELLTRLGVSARQLNGYVENILGAARVDTENFSVQPGESDWLALLKQATTDLAVRAEAKHRHLDLQLPDVLPTVAVDPTMIQHVINNLVDNAIKYSKNEGTVVISVKQKGDSIETTVQDFGIGIPGSLVDNLFTKFYRSHRSKQAVGGTGLGLYLCKAIVEAHGGSIWVRSSEGMGTTFGFTLPTYASVAEKLKSSHNDESGIVRGTHGWIKNHALVRR